MKAARQRTSDNPPKGITPTPDLDPAIGFA